VERRSANLLGLILYRRVAARPYCSMPDLDLVLRDPAALAPPSKFVGRVALGTSGRARRV